MIRAFFAIPIMFTQCHSIQSAAQPIIEKLGDNVRWVSFNHWHLTVRFLGDVHGEVIAALTHSVQHVVEKVPVFQFKINKIYGFPSMYSRTIAAHAFTNKELNVLFKELDDAANLLGLPRELRRFRPHITLAKFKARVYPYDPVLLKDFILTANELVLYQSKPDKQNSQSEYIPLQTFPFIQ